MGSPVILNQLGPRATARLLQAHAAAQVVEGQPGAAPPAGAGVEVVLAFSKRRPDMIVLCEPSVRWIHLCGAGVDGLPDEAFSDGRIITSSKGASSIPISEFVLASMLAFEKRFPLTWLDRAPLPTPIRVPDYGEEGARSDRLAPSAWGIARLGVLAGKTVGLIGYGGIGEAVAVRARAFGMRVVVLRRRPELGVATVEGDTSAADIHDLVAQSDHLVVAAPLTPQTRHLIDREALAVARPGLHIVNISRGGVIDQDALLLALDEERVAFASLDVTDPEPLPEGHRLYTHPRVHLSPHVSWSMPNNLAIPVELFVENLGRYVAGQPLRGVVDRDEGY